MKEQTLLEKARAYETTRGFQKKEITQEEIDLAIAWMSGGLRLIQVAKAYDDGIKATNTGNVLGRVAQSLRKAYELGLISTTKKGK